MIIQCINLWSLDDTDNQEKTNAIVREQIKFETLKKEIKTLAGFELMISDGKGPVAMAGVIGGIDSGVSDSTTDIFLESANFNQAAVRKASRHHQIETDSAYRFSRGVSQQIPPLALERATELILQVAGGQAVVQVYDEFPQRKEEQWIDIKPKRSRNV